MRIAVIADIHGKIEPLKRIMGALEKDRIDLIIAPGDFTDMFDIPEEFSHMDMANMVLQKLLALRKPLLCVPGNHDPYEIIELFEEHKVNLHDTKKTVQGLNFVGWGGAPTPFNTIFEPSDRETSDALKKFRGTGDMVLVVHDPPKDTKLDVVKSGQHVGSPIIRKFIEDESPILAISAHIHEAGGQDKIGKTTLFYPGPAYDGYYGTVDIKEGRIHCEIKKA